MSRTNRRFLIAAALIVSLALGAPAALPFLVRQSNCGGNSAALTVCNAYVIFLKVWASDHEDRKFQLEQADQETREELGRLPGAWWIKDARFFARIEDMSIEPASKKRVILVCDHPFDNVPQRRFGRSPLAHAVAYSTGETGLISTADFARLNLSGFIDLQDLVRETKVGPEDGANKNQHK